MQELLLLMQEQCFGKNRLEIFNKRGFEARITDFSLVVGGYTVNWIEEDKELLKERTTYYWTSLYNGNKGSASIIDIDGNMPFFNTRTRDVGIRPSINYKSLEQILESNEDVKIAEDGVLECKYGYYPQTAAPKDVQEQLERNLNKLEFTGNRYTTDYNRYNEFEKKFVAVEYKEYAYEGKKYVRVIVNSCFNGNEFQLSNGEFYKDGDFVWIEVEPVNWLIDENSYIMVSEKCLISGIQFNNKLISNTNTFCKTDIYLFLNLYLNKEIEQVTKESLLVRKLENEKKKLLILKDKIIELDKLNYKTKENT